MPTQKSNEEPTAVLEVCKGMVQEVYANVPLKVVIVDWDTQGVEEGAPGVLSVPVDGAVDDRELCLAAFLSPRGLTRLPRSLRKALQAHSYLPAASPSPKRRKGRSSTKAKRGKKRG